MPGLHRPLNRTAVGQGVGEEGDTAVCSDPAAQGPRSLSCRGVCPEQQLLTWLLAWSMVLILNVLWAC